MMWVMARATLQTFVVACFTSPHPNVSTERTDVEVRAETMSWREKMVVHGQGQRPWLRTCRCKKVSRVLPEKTPLHIHKIIFPKTKSKVDRYANFAKIVLFTEKLE